MQKIVVTKRNVDEKSWLKRAAQEGDCKTKITQKNVILEDTDGNVVAAVVPWDYLKCDQLVKRIRGIKTWNSGFRANGTSTISANFGFQPRNPTRQNMDWCTNSQIAFRTPELDAYLKTVSNDISTIYKKVCGSMWKEHFAWTEKNVLPEWRLGATPWTSGIINNNFSLMYHRDRGNLEKAYSGMIVAKKGISGGNLCLPEYDAELVFENGDLLFFNGSEILHGVTPFSKLSKDGYRYSFVFYTLKMMCKCMHFKDELNRARQAMDKKARGRLEMK